MANDINFEDIMKHVQLSFTPEKLEEASLNAYKEDREYPENFSNWYHNIEDFGKFAHAEIISNQIFTKQEVDIMEETDNFSKVNWEKINEVLQPTLDKMKPHRWYNIKNGCFSNKFEFDTCTATKENLAEQLWKINYMSSMFSTGGYTELVVREYIPEDLNHCLTIYNGMPLRTELRVFYNMETDEIEYVVDYWDYDYCRDNLKTLNDKLIFDIFHNKTNIEVTDHKIMLDRVENMVRENISTLKFNKDFFKGIWSIDFMYDINTNKLYLIDMARGFRSAYWNFGKLKPETQEMLKSAK